MDQPVEKKIYCKVSAVSTLPCKDTSYVRSVWHSGSSALAMQDLLTQAGDGFWRNWARNQSLV
jgi:hypothetical protein